MFRVTVILRTTVISMFMACAVINETHANNIGDWGDQIPPDEVPIFLPPNYDPETPSPIIIFLHGWAPISPIWYDILVPIQDDANDHGYIYAKPSGSQDFLGDYYWNATDACCDMLGYNPDHVGYLLALVDSIKKNYNIDPQRIHLIGQSNGGFMCHRMACEASEIFASIVSLSGVMWNDESNCQPTEPIHVLQIHGTLDPIIFWLGGYLAPNFYPYPGAVTTAEYWASHNGCSSKAKDIGSFNFDLAIPFTETTRWSYEQCKNSAAGSNELWEVTLGSHFPIISSEGIETMFNYLDTHTKPEPTCLADVTGDSVVGVNDLLSLIDVWGPCGGCDEDINGSGTVDVNDLLAVIDAWGPCE